MYHLDVSFLKSIKFPLSEKGSDAVLKQRAYSARAKSLSDWLLNAMSCTITNHLLNCGAYYRMWHCGELSSILLVLLLYFIWEFCYFICVIMSYLKRFNLLINMIWLICAHLLSEKDLIIYGMLHRFQQLNMCQEFERVKKWHNC